MLLNSCFSCLFLRQIPLQHFQRNISSIRNLFTINHLMYDWGIYSRPLPKRIVSRYKLKNTQLFFPLQSFSEQKGNTNSSSKKPKKEIKTYITLLGVDNSLTVTTVEEANNLATRRLLKLVKKDFDHKTGRVVYQLMTNSQYIREDKEWDNPKVKKEQTIKEAKLISFSSNIGEHDIITKANMMKKWLKKRFEIRVVITGETNSAENTYKIIENTIGSDGRIVQKRKKGTDIRFQILPPKQKEEKKANSQQDDHKKSSIQQNDES